MNNIKGNIFSISSECVGSGHPDKIADQIADAIVDKCINHQKDIQVACEVLVSKNLVVVCGEFFGAKEIKIKEICISVLKKFKYKTDEFKFHINISNQSSNIRDSVVTKNKIICSGDQTIIYGSATNETPEYLPLAFVVARDLVQECERLIENGVFSWAGHDMKSLITLNKNSEKSNYELHTLIFSVQHTEQIEWEEIKELINKYLIEEIIVKKYKFTKPIPNKFINSSKKFVIGGLNADSGLTNRKLIIDTASVNCKHGGGGLSGKDLSKVDRLGAYYARWICKNLVAANICTWVELKLVYFLGGEFPVSFSLHKNKECLYSDAIIIKAIKEIFPTQINQIIELFLSYKISFQDLAEKGHFGRNELNLPWENIDKASQIKQWFTKH